MKVGRVLVLTAAALLVAALANRMSGGRVDALAAETAVAAAPQSTRQATSPAPVPSTPGNRSRDYLGSTACARCHQDSFDQWQRSLHIRMTKPIAEATVLGEFTSDRNFSAHDRSYQFGRADGRPTLTVSFGGSPPETFAISYTLGAKRYQGYLSTLPDGRMYVLPVFWHVESRRWVDWKEITPIPDGAHELRQIWNTNCFNCHATNLAQGFDVASKRYTSTWTEMGIGCEACHGPGKPHVELMEQWEKDPASKPAYDNSASNRELGSILKTFSPRSAAPRQVYDTCAYCHGNKQNVFLGFRGGDRYEDYALPYLISAPIPATDYQGEFWPDGRPNRFNRPQALTVSGCFKAGEIACTNCHVAHGSRHPFSLKLNITQGRNGDLLCTQCHAPGATGATGAGASGATGATGASGAVRYTGATGAPGAGASGATGASGASASGATGATDALQRVRLPKAAGPRNDAAVPWPNAAIEAHTYHPAASAGSRCIGCHMSDVNWRLLIRRRDHTFQPPVPETTAAFGVPNACTTCHDQRTPEWAARQMDQWWGDGARRAASAALADTMYRAGSGDASVLPALARLAVDRSQGVLIRGSAVEFMEQLALGTAGSPSADAKSQTSFANAAAGTLPKPTGARVTLTPAQVNALIAAAADPEAAVRARAVTALVASGDRERVITPLVARLVDQARVVRVRAAEALLALGIVTLPAAAGEALTRAQDELAVALQDFPDVATNHAALGWLESERGRTREASAAVERAIALSPRAARPYVVKGVIAARDGRFAEALDHWRKARDLEPTYPNIDRLIEEAVKRLAGGK
jgi:predicted CXXCH cytochrome family protein